MKRWMTQEVPYAQLAPLLDQISQSGGTVFAVCDGNGSRKDYFTVVAYVEQPELPQKASKKS